MTALDPKNLIIASAWIKANATLPVATPEQSSAYTIDFCAFEKCALKFGGDLKEVWTPGPSGGLGLLDLRRVKNDLSYETDFKNLTPAMLVYLMGSTSGSAPIPGKVVKLYFWVGLQGEGEQIVAGGSNIGAGIIVHHSFRGALTIDGDLTADGENFAAPKLTIRALLGEAPGIWTAATRPVTQAP